MPEFVELARLAGAVRFEMSRVVTQIPIFAAAKASIRFRARSLSRGQRSRKHARSPRCQIMVFPRAPFPYARNFATVGMDLFQMDWKRKSGKFQAFLPLPWVLCSLFGGLSKKMIIKRERDVSTHARVLSEISRVFRTRDNSPGRAWAPPKVDHLSWSQT